MTGSDPEAARRGVSRALANGGTAHAGQVYPPLAGVHPVFLAAEQAGVRWRLLPRGSATNPQRSRDQLAHQFLVRAFGTTGTEQASYREAAAVLTVTATISSLPRAASSASCGLARSHGPGQTAPNHPGPPTVPALTGQTQGRCSSRTPMPTGISHQPHSKPPCEIGRARPGPPPELIADERRARTTLTTYLRQTAPTWKNPARKPAWPTPRPPTIWNPRNSTRSPPLDDGSGSAGSSVTSAPAQPPSSHPGPPTTTPTLPRGLDHRHRQQLTHSPNDPSRTG